MPAFAFAVTAVLMLLLLAVLAFLLYSDHQQWRRIHLVLREERAERSELFDRLMAKNFSEYEYAKNLEDITRAELGLGPVVPVPPDIEEAGQ